MKHVSAEQQEKKFIQMTQTPVKPLICKMAVPTIVSMLITSIYNMADTFFVGQIGTSATAAVGVVFPLMSIIQAIGFSCGHGSGNYISRQLGAQNRDEAERMAALGFFSALGLGLLLMLAGLLLRVSLCRLLGATDTIYPYALDYMSVILIGAPYMTASLVLNNQLRMQGNALYAMIGLLSGGLLNILLDPLFIFGFHWGVAGAALATILSQFVSFVLLLTGIFRSGGVRIRWRNFSPSVGRYRDMAGGGLPSLLRQGLSAISVTCLNLAAGPYGDAAIAAMSVVSRIMQFANAVILGFGQGFQPVCGFNYGAKRYDRVLDGYWFCVRLGTCLTFTFAILGEVFATPLVTLFRADDLEVIRMGARALRLQCVAFPLMSMTVISNMLLQNIARTFSASLLAAARQGLFFIPLLLLLPRTGLGLLGVQLCQPISDVCAFITAIVIVTPVLREITAAKRAAEQQ